MTLAAFVGYRSFCIAAAETSEKCQKRLFAAAVGLCFVGILFSHYVLVLHKAWSMGVPDGGSHVTSAVLTVDLSAGTGPLRVTIVRAEILLDPRYRKSGQLSQ